jgi:hypothetical protein
MPGADDALIFADILKSRDRDFGAAVGREGGPALFAVNRIVLPCCYRGDRVMRSLGQEPCSSFPKDHVVEQGDWSLLDPVKARPPMWRKVN